MSALILLENFGAWLGTVIPRAGLTAEGDESVRSPEAGKLLRCHLSFASV